MHNNKKLFYFSKIKFIHSAVIVIQQPVLLLNFLQTDVFTLSSLYVWEKFSPRRNYKMMNFRILLGTFEFLIVCTSMYKKTENPGVVL